MFWIDIVLVSVFVLLFLFMFYSIAKNKVDLEDEYIERKILLDERKKANNSTKMVDLERQLKTASASERRSIKREIIKLKQKNNATSQDQNRIFDSSLLKDVQTDVAEADKNDLRELEKIERENQAKLDQLSSEQGVERDNMKTNEIASLMATQKNIQDLKNKKVGYDKLKKDKIDKAIGDLERETTAAENQLREDESFLKKRREQVKRAVTSSEKKKAEAALKQAEAAVQLTREEVELNKRKEKVLREGRIDNTAGLDAYNKGATVVRAEANANDGLVRLMEQNKLKLGQTAADREVAKRSQVLIHDREMQQETLEKALALHENKDRVKPKEREELEKIWRETRKANYGRKELGNQIILKEDAKLRANAAQAQEDKVVNDISRTTGLSESEIKQSLADNDLDKKVQKKLDPTGKVKIDKTLQDKLKEARRKRQKNLTESGDLVNIENKITNLKEKTSYPGRFLEGEKTVEQYLSETPEQRERREKNTENLIDRLSYDSAKASDKILDTLQKDDSLLEELDKLKNSYSLDKDGNVISDHQKLFDGLKTIGADAINKLAQSATDPGQSVEQVKEKLKNAIAGDPTEADLLLNVMKKYTNGDFADLGLKKKLNEIISDENLAKFDRVANRKRGKNNFQRAMARDQNSVIPSNFDQRVYSKFGDVRNTGAQLPDNIDDYRELGYDFKTENGITYFKAPGTVNWSKEPEMHSLEKAKFMKADSEFKKAEKSYTDMTNLLEKTQAEVDFLTGIQDRTPEQQTELDTKEGAIFNLTNISVGLGEKALEKQNELKESAKSYKGYYAGQEAAEQKKKFDVYKAKSDAEKQKKKAEETKKAWEKQVRDYENTLSKFKEAANTTAMQDVSAGLSDIDKVKSVKEKKDAMNRITDKTSQAYKDAEFAYENQKKLETDTLKFRKRELQEEREKYDKAKSNIKSSKETLQQADEAFYERADEARLANAKSQLAEKQFKILEGTKEKSGRAEKKGDFEGFELENLPANVDAAQADVDAAQSEIDKDKINLAQAREKERKAEEELEEVKEKIKTTEQKINKFGERKNQLSATIQEKQSTIDAIRNSTAAGKISDTQRRMLNKAVKEKDEAERERGEVQTKQREAEKERENLTQGNFGTESVLKQKQKALRIKTNDKGIIDSRLKMKQQDVERKQKALNVAKQKQLRVSKNVAIGLDIGAQEDIGTEGVNFSDKLGRQARNYYQQVQENEPVKGLRQLLGGV